MTWYRGVGGKCEALGSSIASNFQYSVISLLQKELEMKKFYKAEIW